MDCATRWTRACDEVAMTETPDPETDTLFEIVRQRYAERLRPEQLDELRKIVRGQVEAARALRAVRLRNADEPFQRFEPYRADGPLGIEPLGIEPLTLPSPQRGEGKGRP
jgi:hypothetical protein